MSAINVPPGLFFKPVTRATADGKTAFLVGLAVVIFFVIGSAFVSGFLALDKL